jgi:hypothetical protein
LSISASHLERIVRASHRPVFVASRAFKPIESAIVAYDGGASSQRVVDHIARNKLFSGLKIDLVTVGSRNRDTEKALENARAILTGAGLEVETTILSGQPDEVLGKRVEEHGAALVVPWAPTATPASAPSCSARRRAKCSDPARRRCC